jgi:hypothetical protein
MTCDKIYFEGLIMITGAIRAITKKQNREEEIQVNESVSILII